MSDENETEIDYSEAVQQVLAELFRQGERGAIVTRWVLTVERYTDEGRATAYLAAPDMQSWEVVGMSEMASEYARVQASVGMMDEMYSVGYDDGDDGQDD